MRVSANLSPIAADNSELRRTAFGTRSGVGVVIYF
jgi:hypothetical protein